MNSLFGSLGMLHTHYHPGITGMYIQVAWYRDFACRWAGCHWEIRYLGNSTILQPGIRVREGRRRQPL